MRQQLRQQLLPRTGLHMSIQKTEIHPVPVPVELQLREILRLKRPELGTLFGVGKEYQFGLLLVT